MGLDQIHSDVTAVLKAEENIEVRSIKLIENRYFSDIYELTGCKSGVEEYFILKISTTERSCKNEYLKYAELSQKNINTLSPVHFSEKHNYLLTRKKNIVEFDSVLKNTRSEATRRGYFRRLGAFLKHVSSLTGHFGKLDTAEYCDYLYPRLDELLSIDAETRSAIKKRVESILDSNKSKSVFNCLVSDFALGNLHIDENDQFVLVDLGDATFGNQYDNISYIYLNLKFGSLSLYFDLLNRSERYFLAFLEGYHLPDLDQEMLLLYKFKNLILMISFVESLKSGRKNILRNALSLLSNKYLIYRYKRRLLTELKM
jgi:hypothetical protein